MKRICLWVLVAALTLVLALPAAAATEMEINGVAAVLMDVATGQLLYEKNAHQSLPPASVTKVMTMLLIMEALDGGVLRLEDTVTASEAAAANARLLEMTMEAHGFTGYVNEWWHYSDTVRYEAEALGIA